MRKSLVIIGMIVIVCTGVMFLPAKENIEYEYLRLHVRANSNLSVDQQIKYKIKDCLVEILTPLFCNLTSKQQAVRVVEREKSMIEVECNKLLKQNGFNYYAKLRVDNEYFPTRSYENVTLESGFYDAVIIELGEGHGDNWWCVMYPPLCFVNKNENNMQIKYKSKIVEIFKNIIG